MRPKPKPVPTHTFRAVWPIVDGHGTADTDAELIMMAMGDLPNVAHRHNATIIGPPRARIADGRRVPGSGGAKHVILIEAPAIAAKPRGYRHG